MNIKRREAVTAAETSPILGADDDEFVDPIDDTDGLDDVLDDVADAVDDMQDQIDEIDEDDPSIDIENNIDNHYIAECDGCQGVFISAVIESDQDVDHISGVCPLCGKKTDQYLKWVIKPARNADELGI